MRRKQLRFIHDCDDASDMFYCSGLSGTEEIEKVSPAHEDYLDWYCVEDSTMNDPTGSSISILATYCPFCGKKLPETTADAIEEGCELEYPDDDDLDDDSGDDGLKGLLIGGE